MILREKIKCLPGLVHHEADLLGNQVGNSEMKQVLMNFDISDGILR